MKLLRCLFYALFQKIVFRKTWGMCLRIFCQNMGITYIKLAQLLSVRCDIFTNENSLRDLKGINDQCLPISYSKIKAILIKEYGTSLGTIFKSISKTPLGSASISQVHLATLHTGEQVAIKVKRIDVTKNVEKDICFIKSFLLFLSIFSKKIRYLKSTGVIDYYASWIMQECDFEHERQNLLTMYEYTEKLNKAHPLTHVKKLLAIKVFEDYCTENVIVMEYVPHKTLNQLKETPENKKKVNEAMNSYLQLYFYALFHFDTIYYHGDPHTGNLYLDEEGNLGFLDYGLVFSVSRKEVSMIKELALHAFKRDFSSLYHALLKVSNKYGFTLKESKKEQCFKKEVEIFLNKIDDMPVTNWFIEMAFIFIQYDLYVPSYFYEFARALVLIDGITICNNNDITGNMLLYSQFSQYYLQELAKTHSKQWIQKAKLLGALLDNSKEFKSLLLDLSKELLPDLLQSTNSNHS